MQDRKKVGLKRHVPFLQIPYSQVIDLDPKIQFCTILPQDCFSIFSCGMCGKKVNGTVDEGVIEYKNRYTGNRYTFDITLYKCSEFGISFLSLNYMA